MHWKEVECTARQWKEMECTGEGNKESTKKKGRLTDMKWKELEEFTE